MIQYEISIKISQKLLDSPFSKLLKENGFEPYKYDALTLRPYTIDSFDDTIPDKSSYIIKFIYNGKKLPKDMDAIYKKLESDPGVIAYSIKHEKFSLDS